VSEYISEEGLEKLKKELNELKTGKRKEIAERLEAAKALGDLSENAEYQEAKEAQSLVESQIAEMEETLRNVRLIRKDRSREYVEVGSTVILNSKNGEETYTIVGSEEADPMSGKISNESPLGKAVLGRRAGDKFEVKTPAGPMDYTLVKIS
jgi:transcription elongation factor GreA